MTLNGDIGKTFSGLKNLAVLQGLGTKKQKLIGYYKPMFLTTARLGQTQRKGALEGEGGELNLKRSLGALEREKKRKRKRERKKEREREKKKKEKERERERDRETEREREREREKETKREKEREREARGQGQFSKL